MKMYIPKRLYHELMDLTNQDNEVNGALIYYSDAKTDKNAKNTDDLFVSAYFLTGEGKPGQVEEDPKRLNAMIEFIGQNPNFDFTIFHTHSQKTIREFGEYYANNFSEGDRQTIEDNRKEYGPGWWEMLFTPDGVVFSDPGIKLEIMDWENDDSTPWTDTHYFVKGKLESMVD
jgi:hypothetical protein